MVHAAAGHGTADAPAGADAPDVVVRGVAEGRAMPDRAVVVATVDADGSTREAAWDGAVRDADGVDQVLAAHAGAIDRAVTAALVVAPTTRWREGEQVRTGWRATRSTTIELVAFEDLGTVLAELARAGAALAGPRWSIDPDNEAQVRVRAAAAADARARAEAYAGALGTAVGRVLWIAEPGLGRRGGAAPGPEPRGAVRAMAAAPDGPADAVIDVVPDEVTVHAVVEVAFALR